MKAKLAVHDYSRSISKLKPKIRIIHIVEPEIITTTAEDFQQLVQRLTGKPPVGLERKQSRKQQPKKTEAAVKVEDESVFSTFLEDIDGFFHDMNEFPLFSFRSSQINIFGEMPLC